MLVFASMERMPIMTLRDPEILGFMSGANMINSDPDEGWDMERCRTLLREAGFSKLVRGDGSTEPL